MMTDREKLVELIAQVCEWRAKNCVGCKEDLPIAANCREERFGKVADHLIANGVTVQRPTDLTGKCGSCAHATPKRGVFGGAKSYIECKNPEKKFRTPMACVKQRTCKACKMYMPMPEPPKEDKQTDGC